ncbi:Ger(x)C family spore germination protein [Halobacillus sp. A5]|uniref:Ger(x)C family spore germination protein n=1 Tax=Halobacillus sp. A5 TaxID=2880263 RepID=UPI0020A62236|nr:Ger(x)C family spore germination protein [Halobacillus sp. A5]MCP3026582.1 Ger(x)C family spore germination protein [Halobacillus sp. A5]
MRRGISVFFVLFGLTILTGCWDHNELEEVALVMGMGIDKTEDDLYKVSFQIVNPGQVTGGQMTGDTGEGTSVTTYTETGKNIFETTRKISTQVPRNLSFSHMVVLVLGEELAREESLFEVMDFTERYYGFRPTALVLLARESQANSILSILNPMERIPAMKIEETSQKTTEVWGETPSRNIKDVVQTLSSDTKSLSLSGVSLVGNMNEGQKEDKNKEAVPESYVELSGVGMFKEGKLQGWLDDKEARGMAWVQDEIKRTVLTFKCDENEEYIAAEVRYSTTKLSASIHDGKPEITVDIRGEGPIEEAACPMDLTDPEIIYQLNEDFGSEIEQEVIQAVKIAQEQEIDLFGFGETVNQSHPEEWKSMRENWDETFSEMDVNVNTKFFIRKTGLRTKPLILQKSNNEN